MYCIPLPGGRGCMYSIHCMSPCHPPHESCKKMRRSQLDQLCCPSSLQTQHPLDSFQLENFNYDMFTPRVLSTKLNQLNRPIGLEIESASRRYLYIPAQYHAIPIHAIPIQIEDDIQLSGFTISVVLESLSFCGVFFLVHSLLLQISFRLR